MTTNNKDLTNNIDIGYDSRVLTRVITRVMMTPMMVVTRVL